MKQKVASLKASTLRSKSFTLFLGIAVGSILGRYYSVALRSGTIDEIKDGRRRITPGVPTFKTRSELATILEDDGAQVGVELGVQKGIFAERILRDWHSCRLYALVDLWATQENYVDKSNEKQTIQDDFKRQTMGRVAKYRDRTKIEVCQNYTTVCAELYRSRGQMFDFIYVDARHDYKGVLQDLRVWWPLLKPGGILAGHDYVTNDDGPQQNGNDWTLNFDGTRDTSGRVSKGAVDDFAAEHSLQLTVSYREKHYNTWATRKPLE